MVVDFCAGAGGKTLALGAQMRNTGRLYAFDISGPPARRAEAAAGAQRPVERATRCRSRTSATSAIKRLAGKVDRVLVDAPCSGLGTLRRNPDLKWRQTPRGGRGAARRAAAAILAAAARLLKPGGRLVYATCSLLESRTRRWPRRSTRASAAGLRAAAGARAAGSGRRSPPPTSLVSGDRTCACGRIGTAPTASSPRSGSDAELASQAQIGADIAGDIRRFPRVSAREPVE